ncbi:SRPBCC family protein [Geminicoccus flavidas]|uniref:SRPBCC family protein n=1 Tax=Geminicoccus flavidas TaxID=2506407 RepID=UPI0013574CB1|nr:SRPBCC domain-containing protein [Geminicoccus flavidas]
MSAKPSLTIRRRLRASPERIWSAWTEPRQLVQWFGPDAGPTVQAETNVRKGGRFHIAFHTLDGERHDVSGEYREVVPHQRLVFTWAWRSTPERESLVTVALKPDGDGTVMTLTHEQFFDEAARDAHRSGWTGAVEKLAALVERDTGSD